MATHTIDANSGDVGAAFTLSANTIDTVTFTGYDAPKVRVINRDGAAEVWFTLDGSEPTVGGANCWYLPAAPSSDDPEPPTSGATVVKLISAGTPAVRVQKGL